MAFRSKISLLARGSAANARQDRGLRCVPCGVDYAVGEAVANAGEPGAAGGEVEQRLRGLETGDESGDGGVAAELFDQRTIDLRVDENVRVDRVRR